MFDDFLAPVSRTEPAVIAPGILEFDDFRIKRGGKIRIENVPHLEGLQMAERVIQALAHVIDPDIEKGLQLLKRVPEFQDMSLPDDVSPFSVVGGGFLRGVLITPDVADAQMTLTIKTCPHQDTIFAGCFDAVEQAVRALGGNQEPGITPTFTPLWVPADADPRFLRKIQAIKTAIKLHPELTQQLVQLGGVQIDHIQAA